MKRIFLLFCLLASVGLLAQGYGGVRGNIIDLDMDEPLLFANISIKDTEHKARTNLMGNFEIAEVYAGEYILEIRFLGYETLEVPFEIKENRVTRIDNGLRTISVASLMHSDPSFGVRSGSAGMDKGG